MVIEDEDHGGLRKANQQNRFQVVQSLKELTFFQTPKNFSPPKFFKSAYQIAKNQGGIRGG